MIGISTDGLDDILNELANELSQFDDHHVTVGIHESDGSVESSDITMAALGAVHELGASINHPGGTSYGYATKSAAEKGQVRFLSQGHGYMELGVTGPHVIEIPARPWLVPGVSSGSDEYIQTFESGVTNGTSMNIIFEQIGVIATAKTQQYMRDLRSPPNAASTVRQKKSSNPLIDSGAMLQSVTYKLTDVAPTEGIS